MVSAYRHLWRLDPDVAFLNHGSFGAVPSAVLEAQQALRDEMETDPVRFMTRDLEPLWDAARLAVSEFVGADPDGVVFVRNATTGVNTLLRSWPLETGDEILVTSHGYRACVVAAHRVAADRGATVRVVDLESAEAAADQIVAAVGPRTLLAIVDHTTSPTALILPIGEIVERLARLGVDVLVDGAHAPGMVDVGVRKIGAAAYTGNLHKWVCAPKGAGFLWVREDLRESIVPLVTSHGEVARRSGRTHLHDRFDWLGTDDPTPVLAVPEAIRSIAGMLDGGWDAVRTRNQSLALSARDLLLAAGFDPVGSREATGSMVAARLGWSVEADSADAEIRRIHEALYGDHRVQMPVTVLMGSSELMVRVSAHLHTDITDIERGVAAMTAVRQRIGTTR